MNIGEIENVRVYQAVKFNGKLGTFFTSESTAHYSPVEFEVIANVGIRVRDDKDHIIIPFPNVAAIHLKTEHKEDLKETRKADREKQAKAQSVPKIKTDPKGAKRL